MRYSLCSFCNKSNNNLFEQSSSASDCYICSGGLELTSLSNLISKGFNLLVDTKSNSNISSFSISTLMPKKWQINEEDIWDYGIDNHESVKHHLNNYIRSNLLSRLKTSNIDINYSLFGDIKLIFNLRTKEVDVEYFPLFIFGRYLKHSSNLSQTMWVCKNCGGRGCEKCNFKGKFYPSIEEEVGTVLKKYSEASKFILHASGREDVDATNSGGRPFVLELKNAKSRCFDLVEASERIKANNLVEVRDLQFVKNMDVELVTESHFDKEYIANVVFDSDLSEDDIAKLSSISNLMLNQRTPERVKHRRADKIRYRMIYSVSVLSHSKNEAKLKIFAEAGTYIKEFVSGDNRRTEPSLSSILANPGKVVHLDVSRIDDSFLDFFFKRNR